MHLSDSLVTQSNNNYSYCAYTKNLFRFCTEAKNSQLTSILWHRNTFGQSDILGEVNIIRTKRKRLAAESKEIDMHRRLHLNLFFQNCYLLNGVEVKFRLFV